MPALDVVKSDLLRGLAQGHPLVDAVGEVISLDELTAAHRAKNPRVIKADSAQQIVYGWAGQYLDAAGQPLEDLQGDMIAPEEIERAAYAYVLDKRASGVMHEGKTVGHIVASLVTTPDVVKAFFGEGVRVPVGWIIGVKYQDKAVFKKVLSGELSMFSIQGNADRVEVP